MYNKIKHFDSNTTRTERAVPVLDKFGLWEYNTKSVRPEPLQLKP